MEREAANPPTLYFGVHSHGFRHAIRTCSEAPLLLIVHGVRPYGPLWVLAHLKGAQTESNSSHSSLQGLLCDLYNSDLACISFTWHLWLWLKKGRVSEARTHKLALILIIDILLCPCVTHTALQLLLKVLPWDFTMVDPCDITSVCPTHPISCFVPGISRTSMWLPGEPPDFQCTGKSHWLLPPATI